MTRPYSNDLRERALARVEKGETIRSVATALQVSPSCVSKWGALKRRTGHVAPGKIGGHRKPTLSGGAPLTGSARACGRQRSRCAAWWRSCANEA
jgi:transposase